MEQLLVQIAALAALLPELQQKLADAQATADALAMAKFEEMKEALKVEFEKVGYDKGFADGVASVVVTPPVTDKIFSQEEADALVAAAVEPLEKKIVELEASLAKVPEMVQEGITAFKAELMAKYTELQVAETAAEVGFGELLK